MPEAGPEVEDVSDLPYRERPEWSDVTPLPQDDGPLPLVEISYPPGFTEVHDYFRAIQQRKEYSQRALELTADVIQHNSANYTAWYYRRRCLKNLDSDLFEELDFTHSWACGCPKNYQVWYHRRWLIAEIASQLRSGSASEAEAADEIRQLAIQELAFHLDVMNMNKDYKNYNGWSHRVFIARQFDLWEHELVFVESLLVNDVRNNSAWNHRFTVLRNTAWPWSEAVRQRETAFALDSLRACAQNESAWNYLAAFHGKGEGKAPWGSVPQIAAFCHELLAAPSPASGELSCRFAAEVLAQLHEERGELSEALGWYQRLEEHDSVRASYWVWRAQLATKQISKEE